MKATAVLALLLAAAAPAPAAAQAITLSPAVVPLGGRPGQSSTQTLTLSNSTSLDLRFMLEARDVVAENGARVWREPGQIAGGIAATAVFSQPQVDIPAGASRSVTVTVTPPGGAASRAVVVLFRGITPIRGARGEQQTASIGTLLTFSLGGVASLDAAPLAVEPQTASADAAFSVTLTADGSEPVVAKSAIAVLDDSGRLAGRTSFDARRLVPGERATLRAEYPAELPPGRYRVICTIAWEGGALTREAPLVVAPATIVGARR